MPWSAELISAEHDTEEKSENSSLEPEHQRKIFLANLSYGTKERDVKKYFEKFGNIEDAEML